MRCELDYMQLLKETQEFYRKLRTYEMWIGLLATSPGNTRIVL